MESAKIQVNNSSNTEISQSVNDDIHEIERTEQFEMNDAIFQVNSYSSFDNLSSKSLKSIYMIEKDSNDCPSYPSNNQHNISMNYKNSNSSNFSLSNNSSFPSIDNVINEYSRNASFFSELTSFVEMHLNSASYSNIILTPNQTNIKCQNIEVIDNLDMNLFFQSDFQPIDNNINPLYQQPNIRTDQVINHTKELHNPYQQFPHVIHQALASVNNDECEMNKFYHPCISTNQHQTLNTSQSVINFSTEMVMDPIIIASRNDLSQIDHNSRNVFDLNQVNNSNICLSRLSQYPTFDNTATKVKTTSLNDELFTNVSFNIISTQSSCHYKKDQVKIIKFLLKNQKFSSELNEFILNNKFEFTNDSFINELVQKLKNNIRIIKENLTANNDQVKVNRTFLVFTSCRLENFCFFCKNKTCHMFSSTYKYSNKNFNSFTQCIKSGSKMQYNAHVYAFLQMIQKIKQKQETCNLNSFLFYFMEQRKVFFKFLEILHAQKIYLNRKQKLNLIEEVFHNFKCYASRDKIRLIPEFIPLLFLMLNRDIKIYYRVYKITFFVVLFYIQSFNQVFTIISRHNFFEQKLSKKERKQYKMYKNLVTFLLRINFVEPFVIFFTRNEDIVQKYRFHILSLFHLQCLSFQNKRYDQEKMKFLEKSIYWIFNCVEHLNPIMYNEIYQTYDMKLLYQLNKAYFHQFSEIFAKFWENESYLHSNAFKNDDDNEQIINLMKFLDEEFKMYET